MIDRNGAGVQVTIVSDRPVHRHHQFGIGHHAHRLLLASHRLANRRCSPLY
ncbi:hypothetical protein trd_A0896 (plasmid) [Thermomicrobium roseum DSM 5159]|uniref:Uncharacterized protein n=1 Tax=Thermomicrobium roseum (strain ATCC 27502 / DSM 5159 / P-2) TaxID=309801 RepID=B9L532_THERP|nr:hypothetical protein trd_A0896 [Thermomicrobium roseum DSM 5159]